MRRDAALRAAARLGLPRAHRMGGGRLGWGLGRLLRGPAAGAAALAPPRIGRAPPGVGVGRVLFYVSDVQHRPRSRAARAPSAIVSRWRWRRLRDMLPAADATDAAPPDASPDAAPCATVVFKRRTLSPRDDSAPDATSVFGGGGGLPSFPWILAARANSAAVREPAARSRRVRQRGAGRRRGAFVCVVGMLGWRPRVPRGPPRSPPGSAGAGGLVGAVEQVRLPPRPDQGNDAFRASHCPARREGAARGVERDP